MSVSMEELQAALAQAKALRTFMQECQAQDVSYDMARVLIVQQKRVTMGEATDILDTAEKVTGISLER